MSGRPSTTDVNHQNVRYTCGCMATGFLLAFLCAWFLSYAPAAERTNARHETTCEAAHVRSYPGDCCCSGSRGAHCSRKCICFRHTVHWQYHTPEPVTVTRDEEGSGPPVGLRVRCWYSPSKKDDLSFQAYSEVMEGRIVLVAVLGVFASACGLVYLLYSIGCTGHRTSTTPSVVVQWVDDADPVPRQLAPPPPPPPPDHSTRPADFISPLPRQQHQHSVDITPPPRLSVSGLSL